MRESKAELTDRLRREGRFEAFKKRREELKAEGTPAKHAWYQAAVEFPPEGPRLSGNPAGSPSQAIEPWVKWDKNIQGKINAASNAFDWLLLALPVKLPRKAAKDKPALYSMLLALRSNPALLHEFYRLAMRRWADAEQGAIPPKLLKLDDILNTGPRARSLLANKSVSTCGAQAREV